MTTLTFTIDTSQSQQVETALAVLSFIKQRDQALHDQAVEAFSELSGAQFVGHVQLPETWQAPTTSRPTDPEDPDSSTQAALNDLWPRLGLRLRELMKAAARFDEPYKTQDLAESLGTDVATAKSWRANLGRSLNAVAKNHPDAPPFFDEHPQPGGGWRYSVNPHYRQLIADLDLHAPLASGEAPN